LDYAATAGINVKWGGHRFQIPPLATALHKGNEI